MVHVNTYTKITGKDPPMRSHLLVFVNLMIMCDFRSLGKSETIAVLMNVGSESEEICPKDAAEELPDEMFVHTCSGNSKIRVG